MFFLLSILIRLHLIILYTQWMRVDGSERSKETKTNKPSNKKKLSARRQRQRIEYKNEKKTLQIPTNATALNDNIMNSARITYTWPIFVLFVIFLLHHLHSTLKWCFDYFQRPRRSHKWHATKYAFGIFNAYTSVHADGAEKTRRGTVLEYPSIIIKSKFFVYVGEQR